jgi:hypothetical protein
LAPDSSATIGGTAIGTLRAIGAHGKGVMTMDERPNDKVRATTGFGANRPQVRVTTQYLRQRGKVGVTLTREDLTQLAHLIKAGRVWLQDDRSVGKNLRAAMTKMGIDTNGL